MSSNTFTLPAGLAATITAIITATRNEELRLIWETLGHRVFGTLLKKAALDEWNAATGPHSDDVRNRFDESARFFTYPGESTRCEFVLGRSQYRAWFELRPMGPDDPVATIALATSFPLSRRARVRLDKAVAQMLQKHGFPVQLVACTHESCPRRRPRVGAAKAGRTAAVPGHAEGPEQQ